MMKAGREEMFLDLGCGIGTTSRLLAEQFGCRVVGIDASPSNAGDAMRRTVDSNGISFLAGDGEHVPLAEETFDGAMMECVLSTFRDKPAAAAELSRVLKSNGRLGVSDVAVEGELPEELRSPLTDVFCVGRALSVRGYLEVLERGGFEVQAVEKMEQETLDFLGEVRRQIFLAKMLAGVGKLGLDQEDLDYARHLLALTVTAVEEGKLGYVAITARKC
jgi:ubiquinone/menaquinone biosynthesis C-methylase UbiE